MAIKEYKVIVTAPAFNRYSSTILPYLKKYFSPERALDVQQSIEASVKSIRQMPGKGSVEPHLMNRSKGYRYILHKESRNFLIKIIYFIDESNSTVYVTDFFPTSMNPKKIRY